MKVLAIILLLSLSGCANLSRAKINRVSMVHAGQNREEVSRILGRPDDVQKKERTETWHYDVYSDDSSRSYPYTGVFKDGILQNFYADSARDSKFRELCVQRKNANQSNPFARSDGSPALQVQSCGE